MKDFVIVIHGGAENKTRRDIGSDLEAAYRRGLEEALLVGWEILNSGGAAIDAVEAAVRTMENNYIFNAGKGGAYTEKYKNEFDASIMCGQTLKAGAVAGVQRVKNPINLAKTILDKSKHVLLTGEGAEEFALEHHLEFKPIEYFRTKKQLDELEKTKEEEKVKEFDTVGAVALDKNGNLAAATSTGGLVNQHNGRVGDTPIIGAGTYANNEVCAISCTGEGEGIMRAVVGHEVYALVKYLKMPIQEACQQAANVYKDKIEGDKNLIALDSQGTIGIYYETDLMFRAFKKGQQPHTVAIWED
ncbi:isoaspartyl peptidase/L-asparaginase family protein [Adhaeribacter pallidiroseus]|uniref:Isoaspartyl peptidase n=1 Tax=Adhaeribacter pallidiroseus TaxID=2072847 RepID=A0A369QIL5_9BACT|nr:isoaspartyl peptidase/L-asparaginase [Adhaeribacter pallidiroseus]RDC64554.1 Beta-aspartyl-peptidase [Adhaeribacter pallidiroseus]